MYRFLILGFFTFLLFSQSFSSRSYSSDQAKSYKNNSELWQDSIFKVIKEVEGAVYIKNLKLRRKVLSMVNSKITENEFKDLKREIERRHHYKRDLKVEIYPLSDNEVRIEINPKRRTARYKRRYDRWDDDWEFDFEDDFDEDDVPGVTYGFNFLMFDLRESKHDRFEIGYSGEFEHNFYRGLAGVRYSVLLSDYSMIRLGSGIYSQGIFQFDWSKGEDGGEATMSTGRLNPNLQVTPQHILGMQLPQISMVHLEYLSENHIIRANLGFMRVKPLHTDSLGLKDDEVNTDSYGFSYSLQYLDNKRFPMNGIYGNFMYQYNEVRDNQKNMTYGLGNDYRIHPYSTGNYNMSYYGGLTAMLEYVDDASIQINGQYIKQKFNQSDYMGGAKKTLNDIALHNTELKYAILTVGLRQKVGRKSILSINYGQKRGELTGYEAADWTSNFVEAIYHSAGFHMKYTYVFRNDINDNDVSYINRFYKSEGAYFSLGISFGSLF